MRRCFVVFANKLSSYLTDYLPAICRMTSVPAVIILCFCVNNMGAIKKKKHFHSG